MSQVLPVGAIGGEPNESSDATSTIIDSLSAKQITHLFNVACQEGPMAIIKPLFTDPRIDPSENNNRAIRTAAEKRQCDIVQFLLKDDRVNPGADAHYVFYMSCQADDADTARKILVDMDASEVDILTVTCWMPVCMVV